MSLFLIDEAVRDCNEGFYKRLIQLSYFEWFPNSLFTSYMRRFRAKPDRENRTKLRADLILAFELPLNSAEQPHLATGQAARRICLPVLPMLVAQTCSLSVSVQIVAGRDDFAERGSVSRSTLRATDALDLSKRWTVGKAPAGHRPALLWLRLRCAGLYRRFVTCGSSARSRVVAVTGARPITNRRYGRLKICATVNRHAALALSILAEDSNTQASTHGYRRTIGDEGRAWRRIQKLSKPATVKLRGIALQSSGVCPPHIPTGMLHPILNRSAVGLARVAPVMFRDEGLCRRLVGKIGST